MGHSIPTQPVLPWAPSQVLLKIASSVPLWEQMKIALRDHCVHFERCLEAHNFIFIQDIGPKIIGTQDMSGSLFLNLLSELS